MSYDWLIALSLVKILAAFAFFFIYLPTKIFPQRQGVPVIDRFFENFIFMVSSAIIFVHVLVVLQIYTIFTLLLCYLACYAGRVWRRDRVFPLERLRRLVVEKTILTLDILDRVVDLKATLRDRWRRRVASWREALRDRQNTIHAVSFAVIFLYAAGLRYADIFRSAIFGYSDPYNHLLWMKKLEAGILYPPEHPFHQFYPKGFHAFLAILHGLTGLDASITVRLAGPLVGALLVLAVYYTGRRLTANRDAALVGMAVFGIALELISILRSYFTEEWALDLATGTVGGWFMRQTAPLPEEFALVFLMPALLSAYSYLVDGARRSLALFSLSVTTVFMIHPIVGAALGVGLTVLGALALLLRVVDWRTLVTLGGAASVAGFMGTLQLIYGALFGQSVETAAEQYAVQWLGGITNKGNLPYTLELLVSGALGVVLLTGGAVLARGRQKKLLWGFFGLYLALLAFLGVSVNFGVRYLIPPDRVGNHRVLLLCSVLAGVYYLATLFPLLARWYGRWRWLHPGMTAISLALLGVIGFPSELPAPPRYEYDALAELSYTIKRSYPHLEWTIVSTVEDYSKLYKDKGWHMNVSEFLDHYNPYEQEIDMPTPYTFLFVEKKLFAASADPNLNRPGVRLDLQRRAQEWTNIYNLFHDDMSIFYEDWDIIVYLITKNPPPKSDRLLQHAGRSGPSSVAFFEGIRRLWNGDGSLGYSQERPPSP